MDRRRGRCDKNYLEFRDGAGRKWRRSDGQSDRREGTAKDGQREKPTGWDRF